VDERAKTDRKEPYGFMEELDALRREFLAPDDAPKPEDIIREAREERMRRVEGRFEDPDPTRS
jgi:hypothetical protein